MIELFKEFYFSQSRDREAVLKIKKRKYLKNLLIVAFKLFERQIFVCLETLGFVDDPVGTCTYSKMLNIKG